MRGWWSVPCKTWRGTTTKPGGHGQRKRKKGRTVVHRDAWEEVHGPIPEGMNVLHRCDNPPCYEVAHLFLGTQADNVRDRDEKGRTAVGDGNGKAKLTAADIPAIRSARANGESYVAIARQHGVHPDTVRGVVIGRTWSHVQ